MDAERIYERSPFINGLLRRLLTEAEAVTACSRDTLNDLEKFYGQPLGPRACVVYNGIDPGEFERAFAAPVATRSSRPFVLAIGRHVPQKGFDVLLRAFAAAALSAHDLVIAGDGPETPSLSELAQSLGIANQVRFPGRADRSTAASLFASCEFFVLPSRREPMGIVNLEAMAAGKAVVASRVGGVPEIVVDGETGLLIEPGNVQALASQIRRLSSDPALRDRLGAAGRRRAEQFSWTAIAQQYQSVYEQAARSAASH